MKRSKIISVREAARMRGVTLKAIYDKLYAGRLAGATKIDGQWRIPISAIKESSKASIMSSI